MLNGFEVSDNLKKNLIFLGITILLSATIVGAHNLTLDSEEVPDIGFMDLEVDCKGIDSFVCLGIQTQEHTTLYYAEWEEDFDGVEEGTEEHRRLVETELMVRAYDECQDLEHEGMSWTSEVEYENKTADEWQDEIDEVTLLPCEETYRFSLEDEPPF